MTYLLDTNVCVQYLRGRSPHVRQRLASTPPADVHLCSVVKAELYFGALRSVQAVANRAKVDAFVQPYISLPFDEAAADIHARIRYELETAGKPIGPYDLQIAAIALSNALKLVTNNTDEFSRVPA
jgi:tRNA(fMet)-specific endonuclease VapC